MCWRDSQAPAPCPDICTGVSGGGDTWQEQLGARGEGRRHLLRRPACLVQEPASRFSIPKNTALKIFLAPGKLVLSRWETQFLGCLRIRRKVWSPKVGCRDLGSWYHTRPDWDLWLHLSGAPTPPQFLCLQNRKKQLCPHWQLNPLFFFFLLEKGSGTNTALILLVPRWINILTAALSCHKDLYLPSLHPFQSQDNYIRCCFKSQWAKENSRD